MDCQHSWFHSAFTNLQPDLYVKKRRKWLEKSEIWVEKGRNKGNLIQCMMSRCIFCLCDRRGHGAGFSEVSCHTEDNSLNFLYLVFVFVNFSTFCVFSLFFRFLCVAHGAAFSVVSCLTDHYYFGQIFANISYYHLDNQPQHWLVLYFSIVNTFSVAKIWKYSNFYKSHCIGIGSYVLLQVNNE